MQSSVQRTPTYDLLRRCRRGTLLKLLNLDLCSGSPFFGEGSTNRTARQPGETTKTLSVILGGTRDDGNVGPDIRLRFMLDCGELVCVNLVKTGMNHAGALFR